MVPLTFRKLIADVNVQRLKPDTIQNVSRDIRRTITTEFTDRLLRSDVYMKPTNDVDDFNRQLEKS